jgi:hypothetical protein
VKKKPSFDIIEDGTKVAAASVRVIIAWEERKGKI